MIRSVAVEVGADGTRLVVPGPDGRPEPVAVLPAGTSAADALHALVGAFEGDVALVRPGCDDGTGVPGPVRHGCGDGAGVPGRVCTGCDDGAGVPGRVRPVPAPGAVLAGEPDTGVRLVVDAGRSGTSLSVVEAGCLRATETVPVGGDRLDGLVAGLTGTDAARSAREALSVLDRVDVPGSGPVDAARVEALLAPPLTVVADRVRALASLHDAVELVLVGGLARTPLLAALLDERVACPVRVPPEPDLAAVRGALRWLEVRLADGAAEPTSATVSVGAGAGGAGAGGAGSVGAGGAGAGGGARFRGVGRLRRHGVSPAVVALGAVLVGAGTVLGAVPEAPAAVPEATLVQYGYATALPAGWEHTGGDPGRRRTLLSRVGSPDGVELISVERSPLGYDGRTEPDRARAELAEAFRDTSGVHDLRPDTVSGRAVTRYVQPAGPDAVVDWFVLFDGTDQLTVGCRRPVRLPAPVLERACADVVGSVRSSGRAAPSPG